MNQTMTVQLLADISRFQSDMDRAGTKLAQFGAKAQSVGSALSIGISAPLGLLAKKAVDAYGEMDALTRGLATLERSAGSLKARLAELQEVAKLPGLGLKESIQFDVSLRSAGFSADLSKKSMLAFGNALASIGKGKNELKGVSLQLQQLAGKTGGFGADLRIIKEYAPQVGAALQSAFGTTNTEAIAKLGVTGKQVIEKIVAELAKLPQATGGIKNAMENLEDSTFRSMAKLGESLNNALGIEGLVNKLGSAIASLVDWFAQLSPPTQAMVAAFAAALVVIPPLLAGLGFLASTVLPAVGAGFALLTGPIGIAIAAVAAAAALIVMHWDKVKKFLLDSNLWDSLGDLFKNGLGFLTSVFGVFANLFQGDWANMWEHAKNVFKYAWNSFISIAGSGVLAVGGLFAKMLSFMKLDSWAKAVQGRMNEVFLTMRSRQFEINSPKVKGGLFEGLNFGGAGAGKTGGGTGGGGKSKGAGDPETYLQKLQNQLSEVENTIKTLGAKGIAVPEYLKQEYAKLTDAIKKADDALKALQKTDITGGTRSLESKNVIKTKYTKYDQKSEPVAFSMAAKLPGLEIFQEQAQKIRKATGLLQKALQVGRKELAESSVNLLSGIGEALGNGGKEQLNSILKVLLNALGDFLIKIGSALLIGGQLLSSASIAFPFLAPLFGLKGVAGIATGAALVVGGGAVKAFTPMASGGIVSGPQHILAGEYAGASSNPEVVAPLSKLKGMIGDGGGGAMTVTTKVSGPDLLLVIARAEKSKKAYGNR